MALGLKPMFNSGLINGERKVMATSSWVSKSDAVRLKYEDFVAIESRAKLLEFFFFFLKFNSELYLALWITLASNNAQYYTTK